MRVKTATRIWKGNETCKTSKEDIKTPIDLLKHNREDKIKMKINYLKMTKFIVH